MLALASAAPAFCGVSIGLSLRRWHRPERSGPTLGRIPPVASIGSLSDRAASPVSPLLPREGGTSARTGRCLEIMGWEGSAETRLDGSRKTSDEHTSELQSQMRTSYAVYCMTKKQTK